MIERISDIRGEFPTDVQGPTFDDEFGDVYGNVYAVTGDGFSPRQVRDAVERLQLAILDVPGLGKTQIVGGQAEAIYLNVSTEKLAGLGIDRQALISTLQAQNAISATGVVQAGPERVSLRVGGEFASEDSLKDVNLRVNGKFFRLSDIATITRAYQDPPQSLFRVNGEFAVGLAVGMRAGTNIIAFGEILQQRILAAQANLPVGLTVAQVSNQPAIVVESVNGFVKALVEAIIIVLAVSFVSLGLWAGLVVSISIPLVLAITFVIMEVMGISLQRISLGAPHHLSVLTTHG